MSTADNSFATRNRRLMSRTLAAFHSINPNTKELGPNILDQSTYLIRRTGTMQNIIQTPSSQIIEGGCGCTTASCTDAPSSFSITVDLTSIGPFDPPYDVYNTRWDVSWDPVPGATSYTVTCTENIVTGIVIVYSGGTTAIIYSVGLAPDESETVTVTALNDCGTSAASGAGIGPCFLAGSMIQMADGTQKVIEDVVVGDLLLGAFGEINEVLALHRPLLGNYHMAYINQDHYTSAHHPHVTIDKQFVCAEPATTDNDTYGREHIVINAAGEEELRMLHGLKKGRVQLLTTGVVLKGITEGRRVETVEIVDMPSDTQLYNLVVGGSHTYYVDGYAVTGWPREDDFDYDTWQPIVTA